MLLRCFCCAFFEYIQTVLDEFRYKFMEVMRADIAQEPHVFHVFGTSGMGYDI